MKNRMISLIVSMLMLAGLFSAFALPASALDATKYMNDDGYRVTLGGFQRTNAAHLRPFLRHDNKNRKI